MNTTPENKTFLDVLASVQTGDKATVLNALDEYRTFMTNKLLSPWFVGPVALIYAFRGKLTLFERSMLGLLGVAAMYNEYLKTQGTQPIEKIVHPLAKYSEPKLLPSSTENSQI